ncbi:MAG: exodeoxyribonuclease VII large subunit [Clostridium sp.]|nr:exodeoxyribonuclease VII large subunit [Clostridium sp.]
MNVITVSQLNTYIKSILDENPILRTVYVVGEISNFLHYYKSGHMYFTLKDERSQLKAVMFNSYASRVKFKLEDGMRVICRGRLSAYEKDGVYQLYVEDVQPDGVGALNLAFEQLKEKLAGEGLFDTAHKKALPKYPKRIGVATSNMGAAIEDIKNITARRYPIAEIVIAPTIVQGEAAAPDIVKSIRLLDSIPDIDVIIVGRGGGSIEDLWAFNTEMVARAVFECSKPIISAVGHETDFTICDFVADVRAETPSAAAEKAVPDIDIIHAFVQNAKSRMVTQLNHRLEYEYQRLDKIQNISPLGNFNEHIENYKDILDSYKNDLRELLSSIASDYHHRLGNLAGKLDALSPLAVISRGYAVATDGSNIIKSVKTIQIGDKFKLKLSDGTMNCTVDEVKYE